MKKTILVIASFFTLLGLTGCEQTVFGVPKDQWNRLTPQQQSQVIDAYNQRQQTEAQNAPIMAAIGAASSVLNNKTNADLTSNMANSRNIRANTTTPDFPATPNFPSMPNIPMQGGCTTQGNATNCNYSGSMSKHTHQSSSSNSVDFPKF